MHWSWKSRNTWPAGWKALASKSVYGLCSTGSTDSKPVGKIAFAAAVHDISELAMNDFPMNKPGRFTGAGHLMVQQHVMLEASILDKLDLDPDISSMVLQHHENFDGSGYPNGLSGEQICLGARIFRIVDTYDA